jgi:hypothetical protein
VPNLLSLLVEQWPIEPAGVTDALITKPLQKLGRRAARLLDGPLLRRKELGQRFQFFFKGPIQFGIGAMSGLLSKFVSKVRPFGKSLGCSLDNARRKRFALAQVKQVQISRDGKRGDVGSDALRALFPLKPGSDTPISGCLSLE